ncbi:MAG: DUF479 domain-containing protein [Crocinitomicaceae bacterium]|nr:DUF479 domain-containing protein [Crocinitomicaceae bacterium]
MNFLGHAYIARNHPELIAGNFAGDSYKGNLDNFDLPKNIIDGIRLHRYIDDFTDHSDLILKAGHIFRLQGIQKIVYIGTDIIMDHYLAREWNVYSSKDYDLFVQRVYQHTDKYLEHLAPEFQGLYTSLKKYKWLYDYPTESGIRKILTQFSQRLRFDNELIRCMDVYLENQVELDHIFSTFLIEIKHASVEFIEKL